MRVLGIDFSLNGTGLAIYDTGKFPVVKVFTTEKKVTESIGDISIFIPSFENQEEKLDYVCETIENFIKNEKLDFICMEEHTASNYSWMDGYAILKYKIRKLGIPYITIAPTSLKKYAGTGKADKTQMSYYLRRDYGVDFDYLGDCANNIVDACWLSIVGTNYNRIYIQSKKIKLEKCREEVLKNLNKKYDKKQKGKK